MCIKGTRSLFHKPAASVQTGTQSKLNLSAGIDVCMFFSSLQDCQRCGNRTESWRMSHFQPLTAAVGDYKKKKQLASRCDARQSSTGGRPRVRAHSLQMQSNAEKQRLSARLSFFIFSYLQMALRRATEPPAGDTCMYWVLAPDSGTLGCSSWGGTDDSIR